MQAPTPPPHDALPPLQWGGVLLVASVGLTLLAWLWFTYRKWRAGRGRMDSVAAGALRLAAARGRLEDLRLLATLAGFQVGKKNNASRLALLRREPGRRRQRHARRCKCTHFQP